MPISQLKQMLGHRQLAVTQRYVHTTAADLARTLRKVRVHSMTEPHEN